MKIRTVYFKVKDMEKAAKFWSELLQIKPHKTFPEWHEFMCDNIRLGLLLLDENVSGAGCVPVFEMASEKLKEFAARAKALGASTVFEDTAKGIVVLKDLWNNEFELAIPHD